MQKLLFAVYDSKAEFFFNPFTEINEASAKRAFGMQVNHADPHNAMYNNPEDYTLFHIGYYEDSSGSITMLDAPLSLGVAITYQKEKK